ncbi:hypothetical protein TWF102_003755 [Orbilia oligospora]|uniref:Uncharacterized protein n=1 Tax=Orbilia oligospora TaxID=2813651 RepID=A0A7C8NGW9_ORBOL|nr:hypothetical protein TWF102_003755 [Orbilia oligospora]KAF3152439.1 hypothetical protein TWF594_004126 [Orbilia oligospora]
MLNAAVQGNRAGYPPGVSGLREAVEVSEGFSLSVVPTMSATDAPRTRSLSSRSWKHRKRSTPTFIQKEVSLTTTRRMLVPRRDPGHRCQQFRQLFCFTKALSM